MIIQIIDVRYIPSQDKLTTLNQTACELYGRTEEKKRGSDLAALLKDNFSSNLAASVEGPINLFDKETLRQGDLVVIYQLQLPGSRDAMFVIGTVSDLWPRGD